MSSLPRGGRQPVCVNSEAKGEKWSQTQEGPRLSRALVLLLEWCGHLTFPPPSRLRAVCPDSVWPTPMEKKFELTASVWGRGGSQNPGSGFKFRPQIYSLRLGHKIKSSAISPGQEAIPGARMVGTGSEDDTRSGFSEIQCLDETHLPPLPVPEHSGFRAAP